MVNKKGYLRTVEAVIALVIILVVISVALPRKINMMDTPTIVKSSQEIIREEILFDDSLKKCIVDDPVCNDAIGDVIERNQPIGFDFAFKICSTPASCLCNDNCVKPAANNIGPDDISSNVYMADVFVSSTIKNEESTHKVVRFWMWRKEQN